MINVYNLFIFVGAYSAASVALGAEQTPEDVFIGTEGSWPAAPDHVLDSSICVTEAERSPHSPYFDPINIG